MASPTVDKSEVIALEGVSVVRDGRYLLEDVNWHVARHERWVVLGPNGAGKTTMLQVASTYMGPTARNGSVAREVYGKDRFPETEGADRLRRRRPCQTDSTGVASD